jgi:hypothetical protein
MDYNLAYNASSDSINWGNSTLDWDFYHKDWVTTNHYYYPYHPSYIAQEADFNKAFNIAKMLLKKDLLASKRLKDFITLVEAIAQEL